MVSATKQGSKTRKILVSSALLFVLILGLFAVSSPTLFVSHAASGVLTQTASGLIASDPLTATKTQQQLNSDPYWSFGGSAQNEGVQYNYFEDSSGLHIGNVGSTTYAGFFAVSPNTNFMLVHVHLSQTVSTVPSGAFESGMYVQTADGNINYVTCFSFTNSQGTYWAVDYATGNTQQATSFQTLYQSPLGQPLAEDCTIITNGSNYLKVYFNGVLAYQSSSLNLNIPAPFQVYLEPESSYTGAELYTTFLNYYVTSGEYLTVNGLPSNAAIAELINPSSNSVLASAPVSGGSASIEMGSYLFPLNAIIEVLDSNNNVIASTQSAVGIYGGDVYSYSAVTTTTTSSSSTTSTSTSSSSTTTTTGTSTTPQGSSLLTINSVNSLGNPITGYYTELYNSNGNALGNSYTPTSYTLSNGVAYQIESDSYGPCTFDHWTGGSLSGSTTDPAPITITSPTTLTAVYTGSSCGSQTTTTTTSTSSSTSTSSTTTSSTSSTTTSTSSSSTTSSTTNSGPSSISVNSIDQNGNTITGYYTVFYGSSGNVLGTGYTPSTYPTTSGQSYSIEADSYGSCNFVKWSNGQTADTMPFTATSSAQTFTAVYNCGGGSSSPSSVTVNSVDQNGNTITGYWNVLYNSGGNVLGTGYTPTTYSTTAGQSYSIEADSYASCTFAGWSNGQTADPMPFTATNSAQTFTAVYNCS